MNVASYQGSTGVSNAPTPAALGRVVRSLLAAHPTIRVWLFSGPLGAGKSTAIRAVLRGMGVTRRVNSPTYTLAQTYQLRNGTAVHVDAYRIKGDHEWPALGLDEAVHHATALVFVEWPERLRGFAWGAHGKITLAVHRGGRRVVWRVVAAKRLVAGQRS